jgi:Chaperone of endosialidase
MRMPFTCPLFMIAALAVAGSAYATQPPDVVVSDANANTAMGTNALLFLTTGSQNTAAGEDALLANTTGYGNTALGSLALQANVSGDYNATFGANTLYSNTTGFGNAAFGEEALFSNVGGSYNTAIGLGSLVDNTSGYNNTAVGVNSLNANTTGFLNIAIGSGSGYYLTTGDYNIDIGNQGVAGESGVIRIGTSGTQTKTFIAAITSSKVTGSAVYVTTSGRLGVLASSERYKTAIAPMASNSEKLQQLRPVTFHLKNEPKGALQYGLIAEEVAKVYPDLVIRNEVGRIEGVRYEELAPILLNEEQRQEKKLAAQASELSDLRQQFAELKELNRTMQVALMKIQAEEPRIAMR